MEDPAITATYASNILINNLPKIFTLPAKINSVTIDDIKRVANTYFSESNSRMVIVGNGKNFTQPGQAGLSDKKYDKYAEPVKEEIKETPVNESVKHLMPFRLQHYRRLPESYWRQSQKCRK